MGATENRVKSQKTAEDLKRRGIQRRTGKCPWGCGATYAVSVSGGGSGAALMNHLSRCEGGGKRRFRAAERIRKSLYR